MSRYRLSRQAEADLESIAGYVGERSPANAGRVLDASPELGTLRGDLRPDLRVFVAQKPAAQYLIFYYIRPDGISIATIMHGARDYLNLLGGGEQD